MAHLSRCSDREVLEIICWKAFRAIRETPAIHSPSTCFIRAIREDAIDFCSNRYSVPYAPTLLFKVRANMSKCITTPSSRVSPHLLAQRGHTRRAHINDRPLIMPLVAWWEKICAPSDWRTLFWCLALLFSPPFSPPLRLA